MKPLAIPEFPSYVSLVVMLIVVTVVFFIYRLNVYRKKRMKTDVV